MPRLASRKLSIVRRLLPFKPPDTAALDPLHLSLPPAHTRAVTVDQLHSPEISPQLCPVRPAIASPHMDLQPPATEELTEWIAAFSTPAIEQIPLLTSVPRRAGKAYGVEDSEVEDAELFTREEGDERCIHGETRAWCGICRRQTQERRARETRGLDIFDVLFPLLQPPLGENLDSPIAFPPNKTLYPFQVTGVKFLAENPHVLLGDEMGLGKSIQAIVALRLLVRRGTVRTALILCPKSVLTDWAVKLHEWAPEVRTIKVHGPQQQRDLLWKHRSHVYLTTYDTYRQDVSPGSNDKANGITEFDLAILDEIQKVKNPSTGITKAALTISAERRWGLSGTPLENRLDELVSVFAFLVPDLLHYRDASRPAYIKQQIDPYLLRRRKVDALPDLPDKVHDEVWLELSPAQREAYDAAEKDGLVTLSAEGQTITVQHILALITKLKEICNREPVSGESCKLEYLRDQLDDLLEQGDKALVFSQYPNKTLRFLEDDLNEHEPILYDGSLSERRAAALVREFQESDRYRVLLMSVKAGGLGLTLTSANYVFHYDFWWNPAVAAQAEDRAHRIGQKKTVFVTSLYTKGTIEERIEDLLRRKRELFSSVIDDLSDSNLSQVLSEDELFGLFELGRTSRGSEREQAKPPSSDLTELSPDDFEALIALLYEQMGYSVVQTQRSRDGGIDVEARRIDASGTERVAIQCKHYPRHPVGVTHARQLYGVIQADPTITRGILVTSGTFSQDCREFARGKRIDLIDGAYLRGLLARYDVPLG